MRLSMAAVAVGLVVGASPARAQGGARAVTPDVAKAIRALRSPVSKERVDAANLLSRQPSEVVPALLPWSWGCGEGTAREGATPGTDCARINEATYHVLGVLSAIARREPPTCQPSCPARAALFGLTTAQGGIDWDRLPLEEDDAALPAPVRAGALQAYAKVQLREAFPLPDWRPADAAPAARVGATSISLAMSTTPSSMEMGCALALYVEDAKGRVGKLVERDAHALGLGCAVGPVAAAAVPERPGALAVAVDWVAFGGDEDRGQTLLLLQPEKGRVRVLCSLSAVGQTDLLARRAALVKVGPKGCVDAKGKALGVNHRLDAAQR